MSARFDVGNADSPLQVLTSPGDADDSGLQDIAPGERALVIGDPEAAAYAIVGPPGDLRRFAGRVTATVEQALGGEVMPAEVDGMPVMTVFRKLPAYGGLDSTWLVILRETLDPAGGNTYRLCRVRRAGAAGQWEVIDGEPGAQSLSWTMAALWFARAVGIDATPDDGDLDDADPDNIDPDDGDPCAGGPGASDCCATPLQEDRHLTREV